MYKVRQSDKEYAAELIAKLNELADSQDKSLMVYLAEQSDGLRRMFIRWFKRDIEKLEKIKSSHD